jgi:hypothetical protein
MTRSVLTVAFLLSSLPLLGCEGQPSGQLPRGMAAPGAAHVAAHPAVARAAMPDVETMILPAMIIHAQLPSAPAPVATHQSSRDAFDADVENAAARALSQGPAQLSTPPAAELTPHLARLGDATLSPAVIERRVATRSVDAQACLAHVEPSPIPDYVGFIVGQDGVAHRGAVATLAGSPTPLAAMDCLIHAVDGLKFAPPASHFISVSFPVYRSGQG